MTKTVFGGPQLFTLIRTHKGNPNCSQLTTHHIIIKLMIHEFILRSEKLKLILLTNGTDKHYGIKRPFS